MTRSPELIPTFLLSTICYRPLARQSGASILCTTDGNWTARLWLIAQRTQIPLLIAIIRPFIQAFRQIFLMHRAWHWYEQSNTFTALSRHPEGT